MTIWFRKEEIDDAGTETREIVYLNSCRWQYTFEVVKRFTNSVTLTALHRLKIHADFIASYLYLLTIQNRVHLNWELSLDKNRVHFR